MPDPQEPVRTTALRAHLAAEYRRNPRDADRIADLRRQLAAASIGNAIRHFTASAPPLTDAQRRELAALVLGGADAAAA